MRLDFRLFDEVQGRDDTLLEPPLDEIGRSDVDGVDDVILSVVEEGTDVNYDDRICFAVLNNLKKDGKSLQYSKNIFYSLFWLVKTYRRQSFRFHA